MKKIEVDEQKCAIVHHWAEYFRGGEAVLEQFCEMLPTASIYTLMMNKAQLGSTLGRADIVESKFARNKVFRRHFRKFMPFFPEIVRGINIPAGVNYVLSSDASVIKGALMPKEAIHVCYCHSPPRYLWGLEESYIQASARMGKFAQYIFRKSIQRVRSFDLEASRRVDYFIANSNCVAGRIMSAYGRPSIVINPPVDVEGFCHKRTRGDYYLAVSALVPYKRIDLAVLACSKLNVPLHVIGEGPERGYLESIAGPSIRFLGWQDRAVVREHFERCKAFVFPGIEDFGITPCEAQAAGAPVIAYGDGGVLETVADGVSGVFFRHQTVESLITAIDTLNRSTQICSEACRNNVLHLSPGVFRDTITEAVSRYWGLSK